MAIKQLTAKIEDGCLMLAIPLQEPTRSKSGSSLVLATTHGNMTLPISFEGKPIKLGLNAYISA